MRSYTGRVDQQITSALRGYATWTYQSRNGLSPTMSIANAAMFDSARNILWDYYNTASIGATWIISPTLISDTRLGYFRDENQTNSIAYGKNYPGLFGIPNVNDCCMPGGFPISIGNPAEATTETFDFREDVSKMAGTHAFKMGLDVMRDRTNSWTVSNATGSFSFGGCNGMRANGASIPNTGNNWCNYWVGAVSSYSETINLVSILPRDWINGLYIQDDWKARPNLTFNLGVRWTVESQPNNKYGQQSTFNPNAADNTDIGYMGVIQHPTGSMYNRDWKNFQPRVGLAWHPWTKLVIRSGFGLTTVDQGPLAPPTDEYGSITATENQPSGNYFPKFYLSQGPTLPLPWPTVRADGSIPFSGSNYSSRSTTWVNPNRVNPYDMNWNFTVQYQATRNYLLEFQYTGNRGVKGFESWQLDSQPYSWAWNLLQTAPATFTAMQGNSQPYRPWANFGSITYQGQGANEVFHSGIAKIEKRYSYGLTFLAFFTYARSIDDSTSNIYIPRSMDRGRSSFDRSRQFNSSMTYEIPIGKGRKFLNRGGVLNAIFGGYDFVWTYWIGSGNPLTFGYGSSPYQYMPSIVATRSGRPDSTGQAAHLRDDWQDLGGNRFVQGLQNGMIQSMNYFAYPAAYTMGNVGRDTMDAQRIIAASFSASKQWKLKERLTLHLRYDFQNPFQWYNIGSPNTSVNFASPSLFGTVSPGVGYTSQLGGIPIMHITLALHW